MRDVAQHAGVSLATVSYVLNHGPRPVSEPMRRRVVDAMRELGYERRARGRGRRRPKTYGALVPQATNAFFSAVLAAAETELAERGHLLVVASSDDDPERELHQLHSLRRAGIEGLLLTPCAELPPLVGELARRGLPVVLVDRDGGAGRYPRITMNNYASARRAIRVLADCGHRRIAMINGPDAVGTARERLRGYRDALAMAGLEARGQYVRSGPFDREFGRQAARALMALAEPPDAIFSSSAILTAGVIEGLHQLGRRWPDDVALIGFGDAPWAGLLAPPLTTIDQPHQEMGRTAARVLLDGAAAQPGHVVLDSHLILRESHWKVSRSEEEMSAPGAARHG